VWPKAKRTTEEESSSSDFWIPYSDLMAGLLGVFAMLLVTTLYSLGQRVADIDEIVEERKAVVEALRNRFEHDPRVTVNRDTGTLTLSGDVLFAPDEWDLTELGRNTLRDIMPTYLGVVLADRMIERHLEQLIIEGHADSTYNRRGPDDHDSEMAYEYNLELSQKRAFSVMQYMLSEPSLAAYREGLKEFATANGRSFAVPETTPEGAYDQDASRRIEITLSLRDHDLLQSILQAVRGDGGRKSETLDEAGI